MAIQVTCPSCLKRFQVSDKFAGQTGPCPNCEKPIKIPEKGDEVVIHAPEEAGPKDSKGRAVLRPIQRRETKITPPVLIGSLVGSILVLGVAIALRVTGVTPPTALLAAASILLAPPIVMVSYWVLLSDEIEGYGWRELLVRAMICTVVFAGLWALYAYLPRYLTGRASMAEISGMELAVYVPIMILIGALTSVLVMELEAGQGLLMYVFYFSITFLLAWLSGVPLARPLGGVSGQVDVPGVIDPGEPQEELKPPKLLQ